MVNDFVFIANKVSELRSLTIIIFLRGPVNKYAYSNEAYVVSTKYKLLICIICFFLHIFTVKITSF